MAFDRWERRSGLWVRRRDDGDWDYFPTLRAPVAGLRLDAASVTRIGQSDLLGKALAFGVGLPILCFSLVILAARLNLGFLADPRSRGLLYLLGLVIVVAASVARPMMRRTLKKVKETMAAAREVMDPKFSSFAIYEHCLPFNVSRAFDEASGIDDPVIWTAERDRQMWAALQGG